MIALLLGSALAGGFETRVAEVEIAAPPEVVWAVLTDVDAYSEWNPWLVEAEGEMAVGGRVVAQVVLGDKQRRAGHRVDEVTPYDRFCWHDLGWFTLFAKGSRCRTLEATSDGGTRFRVELAVKGMASKTVEKSYGAALEGGLEAETQALRERAESEASR
ncbi:MAG: SRPBCC domain-containing protein [Proteobacteria bacterium]|nr:SRPBCC domain-containing protein [Pseudomonadota bacterium]